MHFEQCGTNERESVFLERAFCIAPMPFSPRMPVLNQHHVHLTVKQLV